MGFIAYRTESCRKSSCEKTARWSIHFRDHSFQVCSAHTNWGLNYVWKLGEHPVAVLPQHPREERKR